MSTARSVSPDGRYVAFLSDATNLVPGDTNGVDDIFIRDVVVGTTVRANLSAQGGQANGSSFDASLSSDDRTVAFDSSATNLFAGDRSSAFDVFLGDSSRLRTAAGSDLSGCEADDSRDARPGCAHGLAWRRCDQGLRR